MTGPALFAVSQGVRCVGDYPCVFCGAPAATPYAPPDSFTARDTLVRPSARHVCVGCVLCLEEVGVARYHDGSAYPFTKAFRRMCSWVFSPVGATAATKAHTDYLRGVCLCPPAPPFAISLTTSGQKHVLYRSVVNYAPDNVVVTLEGDRVEYCPAQLSARLALCGRVAAATGKPALAEAPSSNVWRRVCERYADGESVCAFWDRVWADPVSRLAAFLCPNKGACELVYPGDGRGGIPPAGGGIG